MLRVKTLGTALAGFVAATVCFGSEAMAQAPAPAPAPGPTVVVVQQQGPQIKSPGLVAGGGTLIGLGGLSLLIGIPVTLVGAAANSVCQDTTDFITGESSSCPGGLIAGIVMDVLGAGMLAGGIAMVVIGSEDVTPGAAKKEEPSPIPKVQIGAGNAKLSWSF